MDKNWVKRSTELLIFLWCIFYLLTLGRTQCNVCLMNKAACVNTSSFHLCYGTGIPDTAKLYHCPMGFDCTSFDAICVQSSFQRPPACTLSSQCGLCRAQRNYVFACQSQNTFQMCYGAINPTGPISQCPNGYVCDAEADEICVPAAQTTPTCDRVIVQTTTPKPSTTTSQPLTATQMCLEKGGKIGLYSLNDPRCLTYLSCMLTNGIVTGTVKTCATGSYFNDITLMCTIKKPINCQ